MAFVRVKGDTHTQYNDAAMIKCFLIVSASDLSIIHQSKVSTRHQTQTTADHTEKLKFHFTANYVIMWADDEKTKLESYFDPCQG